MCIFLFFRQDNVRAGALFGNCSSVSTSKTVWWFGTCCFFFPYIGNNTHNWRTHIFQRGRYTMVYHQPDMFDESIWQEIDDPFGNDSNDLDMHLGGVMEGCDGRVELAWLALPKKKPDASLPLDTGWRLKSIFWGIETQILKHVNAAGNRSKGADHSVSNRVSIIRRSGEGPADRSYQP